MLIPDFPFIKYNELICFVNPSGLVELRVRKDRIARYLKNNDKMLQYLRRKIGDNMIFKITSYENIPETYLIIRHPLQDFNKFELTFTISILTMEQVKFVQDHIELFNNLDFVIRACKLGPENYQYIPDRYKSNLKLLKTLRHWSQFEHIPDKVKNNRKIVIYLIKNLVYVMNNDCKFPFYLDCIYSIYPCLSYEFRKDPEIVSLSLSDLCRNYNQAEQIISWIPDNLFNDRNFILSLDINISSGIYRHLSIELQRDYEILLKFGYRYISNDEAYNRIMTPEMKSDVELHKKLMKLNPNIHTIATNNPNNTNIVPKIKYTPIILRLIYGVSNILLHIYRKFKS
jgi:hypothetical protein